VEAAAGAPHLLARLVQPVQEVSPAELQELPQEVAEQAATVALQPIRRQAEEAEAALPQVMLLPRVEMVHRRTLTILRPLVQADRRAMLAAMRSIRQQTAVFLALEVVEEGLLPVAMLEQVATVRHMEAVGGGGGAASTAITPVLVALVPVALWS
jgi:hypothetical protein